MRAWCLTIMATTACSGAVPEVTLACYSERCPTEEQLQVTLDVAAEGLDLPSGDLRIDWYPEGTIFVPRVIGEEWGHGPTGQTDPLRAEWVQVTSHEILVHELAHVAIFRRHGFGHAVQDSQAAHDGEYWTQSTSELVERLSDEQRLRRCGRLDETVVDGQIECMR